jgi:hypothetical protein
MSAKELFEKGGNRLVYLAGAASAAVALVTAGIGVGLALYPLIPKPPPPVPELPSYSSDWLSGGHNQMEICSPILQSYQSKYPEFDISVIPSENSRKDWLGHATYHYNCQFLARQKSR